VPNRVFLYWLSGCYVCVGRQVVWAHIDTPFRGWDTGSGGASEHRYLTDWTLSPILLSSAIAALYFIADSTLHGLYSNA